MARNSEKKSLCDVNYYTARRLEDMARSMGRLARVFDQEGENGRQLSKEDGLAALQTSAAMVCQDCRKCSACQESQEEDGYYLYYLLRTFEQKGRIEKGDMPQLFQSSCRKQDKYLGQLNRNLGRATMNLSWKNRYLESRDAVVVQFREMAQILDEFSRQMDSARDITQSCQDQIRRALKQCHIGVRSLLVMEYENGQREAYITARTTNGRCVTVRETAQILGRATGSYWRPAKDSRSIITRQFANIRFQEEGSYHMLWGVSRIPRQGESLSGDNYTCCESRASQVILSLSDGMGTGAQADKESRQVVELLEELLEAGFSPRSALKLVNTVLLLSGEEQHPATLDLCCVDLHNGVMEAMKLGAAPTFILGENGVEQMESAQVPMGVLNEIEPERISRKLWDGSCIIMVSDGVMDALPGEDKEQVMREYLESLEDMPPQELAEQILGFASSFVSGARDDMTVLAAQIWKRSPQ